MIIVYGLKTLSSYSSMDQTPRITGAARKIEPLRKHSREKIYINMLNTANAGTVRGLHIIPQTTKPLTPPHFKY